VPGTPAVCAVLFVQNVPRMRDFYREVIQMDVVQDKGSWAILSILGFELVIHGIPNEPAADLSSNALPSIREDSYLKICLPVENIAIARTHAANLGGAIKDPTHEWEDRGVRACDGHDPEGNVLQVRQALRE
jgi:catechol 2,3-dioxygenase-like lactoylglutathione lyase family enzyme